MSETSTPLPANPSLGQLQKRAKERVRELRAAGDAGATLADAQFAIAREHGFETWAKLKHHIEALRPPGIEPFEQLAKDLATIGGSLKTGLMFEKAGPAAQTPVPQKDETLPGGSKAISNGGPPQER